MSFIQNKLSKKLKLAGALLALGLAGQAQACGSEPYIGEMCTFTFNYCPQGYLPADGRALALNSNPALFSLLGTTFGGDGRNTFNLPDLRGRSTLGTGQGNNLSNAVLGQSVGTEATTLTIGQLPAHNHGFTPSGGSAPQVLPVAVTVGLNASTSPGTSDTPTNGSMLGKVVSQVSGGETVSTKIWNTSPAVSSSTVAIGGLSASGSVTIPASTGGGTVGVTGNNQPVPTRSPALALTACIATQGIYPARP